MYVGVYRSLRYEILCLCIHEYLQRLRNTFLYPRMYIRHACAMLAQERGQNEPGETTQAVWRQARKAAAKCRLQVIRCAMLRTKALSPLQEKESDRLLRT